MKIYIKAVNALLRAILALIAGLLLISIVIVAAQIVCRRFLGSPLSWSEQTCRYIFTWIMMLTLPILFNNHISMAFDLIVDHLKKGAHRAISLVTYVCGVVFAGFWFYSSMMNVLNNGARIAPGLNIPLAWVYSAQPVCAGLLFLVFIKLILEEAAPKTFGEKEETK